MRILIDSFKCVLLKRLSNLLFISCYAFLGLGYWQIFCVCSFNWFVVILTLQRSWIFPRKLQLSKRWLGLNKTPCSKLIFNRFLNIVIFYLLTKTGNRNLLFISNLYHSIWWWLFFWFRALRWLKRSAVLISRSR